MKIVHCLAALATLGLTLALSVPANAQATRTWVSGVGDDANPCSRTAPCKTFAGAISKTATTGEINCLDSGGFGTVTITKSTTIKCQGVIGGIAASGVPGITVNLPAGGKAVIDGLDIEGFAGGGGTTPGGTVGVRMIGQGTVTIMNTTIRDFTGNGVDCLGTAAGTRCVILNSVVQNNLGGGFNVGVSPSSGGVQNNGVAIGSVFDSNPAFGVQVTAPSLLVLDNNTIAGAAQSISNIGSATVTSYVNNRFNGAGAPTNPITPK